MQKRLLDDLRNNYSKHSSKVYVYLKDEETEKRFYSDASSQGWTFGGINPVDSPADNLIALNEDKQLAHVGAMGRIAFNARNVHRIDYAKYVNGEDDYTF